MNKYQVIWLIIRLAGVYFAYLTLFSFFGLVGSIPALFTLPKIDANPKNANIATTTAPQPSNPTLRVQPLSPNGNSNASESGDANKDKSGESITDKFKGENVKNFAWFLVLTAIYGAAAWYLLRDGRVLYGLLNREVPHGLANKEKEAEVTQLNLSDKQN
jgi:hypothetical protein